MMGQNALEPQVSPFEALRQGSVRAFNERSLQLDQGNVSRRFAHGNKLQNSLPEAITGGPDAAASSAADFVSPSTACLLATYTDAPGTPFWPATDDRLMMLPFS